jgi:hypothetical protein
VVDDRSAAAAEALSDLRAAIASVRRIRLMYDEVSPEAHAQKWDWMRFAPERTRAWHCGPRARGGWVTNQPECSAQWMRCSMSCPNTGSQPSHTARSPLPATGHLRTRVTTVALGGAGSGVSALRRRAVEQRRGRVQRGGLAV